MTTGPLFGRFEFDLYGHTAYAFAVSLLLLTLAALQLLVRSPFGMLCRGAGGPGSDRRHGRLGEGGCGQDVCPVRCRRRDRRALNAISTQVVALDSLSFTQSAEALVMLVLGGTGSLYGALAGTVVFTLFEDFVSAANPFHWMTVVGLLLIGVVLFAPKGLYGTAADIFASRRRPPA